MNRHNPPLGLALTEGLGAAYNAWKLARKEAKAASERMKIARAFNDLYCYRQFYVKDAPRLEGSAMGGLLPRGGNRWMCPECNKIHAPLECSVWTGLQYPACCGTHKGDRHNMGIRTSA